MRFQWQVSRVCGGSARDLLLAKRKMLDDADILNAMRASVNQQQLEVQKSQKRQRPICSSDFSQEDVLIRVIPPRASPRIYRTQQHSSPTLCRDQKPTMRNRSAPKIQVVEKLTSNSPVTIFALNALYIPLKEFRPSSRTCLAVPDLVRRIRSSSRVS